MEKFNNKYRTASARAPFWNYAWNAAYFITICTLNRQCWFGNIAVTQCRNVKSRGDAKSGRDAKSCVSTTNIMQLSSLGHIANSCWHQIPKHFPFVELGPHIIMPNHVHGIVIINKPDHQSDQPSEWVQPGNQFGPQSSNLASIVRGFKIGVTQNARQIHPDFAWQSRYHDHIIRNEKSYHNISEYIVNNPLKWLEDKFYSA